MTNNTLFDEMVEAQQAKYKIEKRLIDEIEQWFDNHGIKASIRLIDYNFLGFTVMMTICVILI